MLGRGSEFIKPSDGRPIVVNRNFIRGLIKSPIKGMLNPRELSLDPSKLIISNIVAPLWMCEALGNILTSFVSNSHFGKQSVARVMTTFRCHVLSNVTNILFFD